MKKRIMASVLIMFFTVNVYSQEKTGEPLPAGTKEKEELQVPYSPLSVYGSINPTAEAAPEKATTDSTLIKDGLKRD